MPGSALPGPAVRPALALAPTAVTLLAAVLLLLHGPVLQLPGYNDFADRAMLIGVANARDVLSNLAIGAVGLWGLLRLWPRRAEPAQMRGWSGYALFMVALVLTAAGSAYYHLAPDNSRLVWDRLPIALSCAGLLAGVRAEARAGAVAGRDALLYSVAGIASVAWWHYTDAPPGAGDLRPYLLLQGLPLVLVPLWQWTTATRSSDRLGFAVAIVLYLASKAAEFRDPQLYAAFGWISGHALKHLLISLAALAIVTALLARPRAAAAVSAEPRAAC